MSLYNIVEFKDTCSCGGTVGELQTKDDSSDELFCSRVSPKSVSEFYGSCEKCGLWFDYLTSNDKTKVIRKATHEVIELKEMPL